MHSGWESLTWIVERWSAKKLFFHLFLIKNKYSKNSKMLEDISINSRSFDDRDEVSLSLSLFSRLCFLTQSKTPFWNFAHVPAQRRTLLLFPRTWSWKFRSSARKKCILLSTGGERRYNNWRLVAKTFRNTNHNPIDSCARSIDIFSRKNPLVNFGNC